jgi:hypothetical protein
VLPVCNDEIVAPCDEARSCIFARCVPSDDEEVWCSVATRPCSRREFAEPESEFCDKFLVIEIGVRVAPATPGSGLSRARRIVETPRRYQHVAVLSCLNKADSAGKDTYLQFRGPSQPMYLIDESHSESSDQDWLQRTEPSHWGWDHAGPSLLELLNSAYSAGKPEAQGFPGHASSGTVSAESRLIVAKTALSRVQRHLLACVGLLSDPYGGVRKVESVKSQVIQFLVWA